MGLHSTSLEAITEIVERNAGFAASSHIAFLLSSLAFTIRTIVTLSSSFLLDTNLSLGHLKRKLSNLKGLSKFFQCRHFTSYRSRFLYNLSAATCLRTLKFDFSGLATITILTVSSQLTFPIESMILLIGSSGIFLYSLIV